MNLNVKVNKKKYFYNTVVNTARAQESGGDEQDPKIKEREEQDK